MAEISEACYYELLGASVKSVPVLDFSGRRLAKIVDVYDGDTCTAAFWFGGCLVRTQLRLHGFDSPEIRANRGNPLEPGEKEKALVCRDALAGLVLNRIVAVEFGPSDHYGRALARLYADVRGKEADGVAKLATAAGGGASATPRAEPPGAATRALGWLRRKLESSDAAAWRTELAGRARETLATRAMTPVAKDVERTFDMSGRNLQKNLMDVNAWMLAATCSVPYGADMKPVEFSRDAELRLTDAEYGEMRGATRESTREFELVGQTYGKVVKVYDGDTCTVAFPFGERLVRVNVRTARYDSPELRGKPGKPLPDGEKELGLLCRDALRALVLNRIVGVDFQSNPKHHNYGRALGQLYAKPEGARAERKRARGASASSGSLIGGDPAAANGPLVIGGATIPPTEDLLRSDGPLTPRKWAGLIDVNEWMLQNTASVPYSLD